MMPVDSLLAPEVAGMSEEQPWEEAAVLMFPGLERETCARRQRLLRRTALLLILMLPFSFTGFRLKRCDVKYGVNWVCRLFLRMRRMDFGELYCRIMASLPDG
jgi:hypothetical protein